MALVMISFLPIMFVIDKIGDIMNQKWSHRYQKLNIKMNADVIEVFDNIKTVKYLNGED
jgi:ABC-type multidrug transport system fused ATPase/permease subunit